MKKRTSQKKQRLQQLRSLYITIERNFPDMARAITAQEYGVPLSVFSQGISPLSAIVIYLKEDMGLSYHHIALLLGRDERSIWWVYSQVEGQKKKAFPHEDKILVPITLFKDKSLSILEHIILFLKKQYSLGEIAVLLRKSKSTIWTVDARAKKKAAVHVDDDLLHLAPITVLQDPVIFHYETLLEKQAKKAELDRISYGDQFLRGTVPLDVFSSTLPPLAALSSFLHDAHHLHYGKIAHLLHRSPSTIWSTLHNKGVGHKRYGHMNYDHKSYDHEGSQLYVPLMVFQQRRLSILEALVHWMLAQGYQIREIALLLKKHPSAIREVARRARRKTADA